MNCTGADHSIVWAKRNLSWPLLEDIADHMWTIKSCPVFGP